MKILLWICTFFTISAYGQETTILNYFTVNVTGNTVLISLEIKGGEQCNGIKVFRSSDNIVFSEIGSIPGICGDAEFAQGYQYLDKNPMSNTNNYYKIELGNQGFSKIGQIFYMQFEGQNYRVFPNPITTESFLYFDNNASTGYTFEIFDASGKRIDNQSINNTNAIALKPYAAMKGTLFFSLTARNQQQQIQGKFICPK